MSGLDGRSGYPAGLTRIDGTVVNLTLVISHTHTRLPSFTLFSATRVHSYAIPEVARRYSSVSLVPSESLSKHLVQGVHPGKYEGG